MQQMLSERGKPLIIFEKYKFRMYRKMKKSDEVVWCCTVKTCSAKLYTLNSVFSKKCGEHNHNLLERVLVRQKINNSVKRKAIEDISERPSKLIHQEINTNKDCVNSLTSKDLRYIRKNINYTRLQVVPKLPNSAFEVHQFLSKSSITTIKEEPFVFINDAENNVIVFSCESNIKFMCLQNTVYMDGTFDYCTKHFLQLFTIHVLANETYVPVAFCLLKDKQKCTYVKLFQLIKDKCKLSDLDFSPKSVVIDFEQGIHSSVIQEFPEAKIIGCRFHLAQAWWRKIQNLGLTAEYKNEDSVVGKWVKHLFGLTFLPPHEVGNCLVEDFMSDKPDNDERVDKFVDYLVDTYIDEESKFPPKIWADCTSSIFRTTNACESFHSKFSKNCSSPHPNINVFVEALKDIQTETYILINSVNQARHVKKSVVNKKEFIKSKIVQYETKNISRYNFVKCVSFKFSDIVFKQ